MSRLTRLVSTVALGAAAFAVTFGVDSVDIRAQIANNPYKVNHNWDKLEGRKIGVAGGIRLDPDGKHLWILDRSTPLAAQSAQSEIRYKARLSPVPVDFVTLGAVTGSGSATAILTGSKLTISGTFEGLGGPATVANLHRGPLGIRGPAVMSLTVTKATQGTIAGSFELKPNQNEDLKLRRLYIQIHSEKAPDGNLWGWLVPEERFR